MGLEGEVSILGFKKAQVFCIKNSSCVKTGKSLRAIATKYGSKEQKVSISRVKTGKSLRAIETNFLQQLSFRLAFPCVRTGKSLRAIAEIWE